MAKGNEFSELHVQALPGAGIVVRFRARRLMLEEDIERAAEELRSLVAPERLMLIDMTSVEYLCSAALGMLLRAKRELDKLAGHLALCGLRPEIDQMFRICRLDKTFDIYPDLESALGESASEL